MTSPILSVSSLLGTDVYSGKGHCIGVLKDLVWNKDSGKISYLIVVVQETESTSDSVHFAIHHSYFYLDGPERRLTFHPKIGKDDYSFLPDLPVPYEDLDVRDNVAFHRYVLTQSAIAMHRSDTEGLSL